MEQQQQLWPRQAQVRQAKKNCLSQVQTNFNHPQVMKTIKYSWFNDHFAMLQLSVAVPKTETVQKKTKLELEIPIWAEM